MSNHQSQQISWFPVFKYAAEQAAVFGVDLRVTRLPVAGTPAWCALPDCDRKWASLLLLGAQYALALETRQETLVDASHAVASAADWSAMGREINQRNAFYADRPWLKRVVGR